MIIVRADTRAGEVFTLRRFQHKTILKAKNNHNSLAMMLLTISAGSIPSVRSAGFSVSVPTNTSVGRPWICSCVESAAS